MNPFDHRKYQAFPPIQLPNRRWPSQQIQQAPRWCSVDLRDGNQALIEPMNPTQKMALFKLLVEVGFKEIEVGFPAASQTDFDFVRQIIEQGLIPEDVTIQVLTQAREELIQRSFEALKGARQAIMHLYNSTSTVQREQVFAKSKDEIKAIAVQGARWVQQCAEQQTETDWTFEYSPESFTGTELEYAVEVCDAVNQVWRPTREKPVIINLPATVEVATPNVYADQIEWMGDHIQYRDAVIISLHTHNDRGCGVAAAELGVMAGADRVEGTLLGNGERTGNMDIVTMAMNLYSQGIDPALDLSNMDKIIQTVTECTQLPVHPRHPYAGELVFTAFSGSHQDAIKKCLQRYTPNDCWQVAYLPIDPADLGRSYQEVIRINSQSGKGGIAYILEQDYGLQMPRWLQVDFSQHVQHYAETESAEVSPATIYSIFEQSYIERKEPVQLAGYQISRQQEQDQLSATLHINDQATLISGNGQGVLDAFTSALNHQLGHNMVLVDYSEHTLGDNERSEAIAYIQLNINNQRYCGVGKSKDIIEASLQAVLSAVNSSMPALEARNVVPA
ncbi:MAG: 2-isopropylmalate synthase [Oceanicoccus sp.]|uniref:2-isopropylmalate synthase n=1 Tax=Oceanicoccus sp. TaxID=2691044 RepID=UPI00262688B1|nr:2-isopropylmalate synthase [Oceanicoccus sp.]MCP3906560.1 2-isopropylmalate synthase [Oceanicoccus sp.]